MGKILSRALRAARFDRSVFTETFFDDDAAADGAILVGAVGVLGYLGSLIFHGGLAAFSLSVMIQGVLASVVSWLVLAMTTWFVASRMFGLRSRPQAMMGLHGLAVLPLLLEVPAIALLSALALVWYLVLLVAATQESGSLSVRDAGVSVLIGFALAALVRLLFGMPFALFGALF